MTLESEIYCHHCIILVIYEYIQLIQLNKLILFWPLSFLIFSGYVWSIFARKHLSNDISCISKSSVSAHSAKSRGRRKSEARKVVSRGSCPRARWKNTATWSQVSIFYIPTLVTCSSVHARLRSETEYCETCHCTLFLPALYAVIDPTYTVGTVPGEYSVPKFMDVSRRQRDRHGHLDLRQSRSISNITEIYRALFAGDKISRPSSVYFWDSPIFHPRQKKMWASWQRTGCLQNFR